MHLRCTGAFDCSLIVIDVETGVEYGTPIQGLAIYIRKMLINVLFSALLCDM